MKKLTSEKVKKYMSWRTDEELRHCPIAIADACNEMCYELGYHDAKDLMRLLCFNDPIPELHTHNYGFHTASGRYIIETLINKYNGYKSNN